MKKLLYIFVALLALFTSNISHAEENIAYKYLLAKYVSKGQKENIETMLVDYQLWSKDPLHSNAMESLQKNNPETLSGKEKMVFWINAYNLLTIDLIVKSGEEKTIKNLGTLFQNPWKANSWRINAKKYTLNQIEHEILRPMGDPRIHVAINCASISCPDLLAEPYDVAKLDSQLDNQVIAFVQNQNKGVSITKSGLQISKIFDWFAQDFGDEEGVLAFIHKHNPATAKITEIDDYLDYNWNLNSK